MRCHEARKLFPLYYDSEGDAEVQLRIGDHLAMCPDCKAWFESQGRCQDALVNLLDRGEADAAMWQRIEDAVLPRPAGESRRRVWIAAAVLAVSLAVVAGVSFRILNGDGTGANVHLSHLAAVEHDRYVKGDWQAPLASESVEEVERWLRANAGFDVRCPPQGRRGFHLQGGGVCRLKGQASAHIVGHVRGRRISIFVLDGPSLPEFPDLQLHVARAGQIHQCHEDPYDMVASQLHGHIVIVMGEGDVDVLRDILLAYGSHHAGDYHAGDHQASRDSPRRRTIEGPANGETRFIVDDLPIELWQFGRHIPATSGDTRDSRRRTTTQRLLL